MNCRTARSLLLTAELADLEGRGDSDLSQHLRSCAPCRALAEEILRAMGELRHALDVDDGGVQPARRAIPLAQHRRTRARLLGRLVPLAAAAGLAGLLLVRRGPPAVPIPLRAPAAIHDVSATAPPGYSLAVLHTDDPNIVVIWFF
jgi:anti-sigma factor RsiW